MLWYIGPDGSGAFRRDHPILWWLTLAGPFVLSAFVLFMVWEVAGVMAFWRLISTALATFSFFGKFVILGGSDGQLLDSHNFFRAEQLIECLNYTIHQAKRFENGGVLAAANHQGIDHNSGRPYVC